MLKVLVLGSAAGGGSPQWNCNSHVSKLVRQGLDGTTPRTQSSIAVTSNNKEWFLFNASPDLGSQILKNKHEPMIIDPLENKLPLLDKRFEDFSKNKVPNSVKNIHKILNKADAIILVSAEYNHLPPPALINLLNYFYFIL